VANISCLKARDEYKYNSLTGCLLQRSDDEMMMIMMMMIKKCSFYFATTNIRINLIISAN
jgi:hypothetical protein